MPGMSEAMATLDEAEKQGISFSRQAATPSSVTDVECPSEGFKYLAGYIARRAAKYVTSLGVSSNDLLCPLPKHLA